MAVNSFILVADGPDDDALEEDQELAADEAIDTGDIETRYQMLASWLFRINTIRADHGLIHSLNQS